MERVHIRVRIKTNKYVVISFFLSIIHSVDVQFAMPMPMFAPPPPLYAVPAGPQIQVAVMPVAIPEFENDEEDSTTTTTPAIQHLANQDEHNRQHHMAIPVSMPMTINLQPRPIMLIPRYPQSSREKGGKEEGSASSEKDSDSSKGSGSCSSEDSGSGSYRRTRKHLRQGRRKKLRKLSRHKLHMSRRAMSRDRPSIRPILSFVDGHGDIKASRKLHRTDLRELIGDSSKIKKEKVAKDNIKQDIKEKRRKLQQSVQKVNDQADNTLKDMALISDFAQKIKKIKSHNPLLMRRQMGRKEAVQEKMNKIFHTEDHTVTY